MRGNKKGIPIDLANVPKPPKKFEAKESKNKSSFFLKFSLNSDDKNKSKVAIKIKPKIKVKPVKIDKKKSNERHKILTFLNHENKKAKTNKVKPKSVEKVKVKAKKKHDFLSFLKHKHKAKIVKIKEKPKVKEIKIKKVEKIKIKPIKLDNKNKHHKVNILNKLLLFKSMVFVSILLLFSITFSLFTQVSAPPGERLAPGQPRILLFAISLIFLSIFVVVLIVQRHKPSKNKSIDNKKMPKIDAPAPKKVDLIEEHFDVDKIDVSKELNKIKKEIDMLRKI